MASGWTIRFCAGKDKKFSIGGGANCPGLSKKEATFLVSYNKGWQLEFKIYKKWIIRRKKPKELTDAQTVLFNNF